MPSMLYYKHRRKDVLYDEEKYKTKNAGNKRN